MRFSNCYIPTLKESPADAEVISHKLLLRAGMVRRLTSGMYTYLPLGLKVIEKISRVVREEMAVAYFEELLMPMVQPAAPPDYDDQRHYQYGNQCLQVGAGAGATRTDPPDDGQGAQLRQQQLRIMPAEQRLAKTGGDVQGGGESDRDNR